MICHNFFKRYRHGQRGFTLVELLVVIVILGILSAVVVFAVRSSGDKGRGAALASDERAIRTAQEAYCAKAGHYGTMDQLTGKAPANGTTETYKFLSEDSEYYKVDFDPPDLQGNCPGGGPVNYKLLCKEDGSSDLDRCPQVDDPPPQVPTALGSWERTGDMFFSGRDRQTTTQLLDGRVLVAGGRLSATPTTTSELYNPVSGTWSKTTEELDTVHYLHTATRLQDGKVLVVGGFSGVGLVSNKAEIFDPNDQSWTPTGDLNRRRALHSSALLPNGKVLVAGGRSCDAPPPTTCTTSNTTATAELYDPTTGQWTLTTNEMQGSRYTTSAALLPDPEGKVIVPGGFGTAGNNTADIYDAETGLWSPTLNLIQGRVRQGAIQMKTGKVMVVSGFGGGVTTEQYPDSSATPSWSKTADVSVNRFNFFWAVLPNGQVLIAGGSNIGMNTSSEIYDPSSNTWRSGPRMVGAHGGFGTDANSIEAPVLSGTGCASHCGKVLLAGDNSASRVAQLYNPAGSGPDGATPPPNDLFADAQMLPGDNGSVNGDNINATKEVGEPAHSAPQQTSGTGSVWYRWTATRTGQVTIDTGGSELNTLLAVYTGPTVAALVPVAQNDDDPAITPRSRVSFTAIAGTEYKIAVDGWGSGAYARGQITVKWALA